FRPFGEESVVMGASFGNTYKFAGSERDTDSLPSLDLMGSRYYASNLGRFLSVDPEQEAGFLYLEDPQAWDGYTYARNNPMVLSDPSGEAWEYCQLDSHGKPVNCHTVSDLQHEKDLNEGVNTFKGGKIYDGD